MPGIGNADRDISSGFHLRVGGGISIVERGVARLDGQAPAVRHRVAPVCDKVENRVLQLAGVDHAFPQADSRYQFDVDVLRNRSANKLAHVLKKLSDIDGLRAQRLLPGKSQKAVSQSRSALDGPKALFSE